MKAQKHNALFDEDYTYFVRRQMKKNAQLLRKNARKNKAIFQCIPVVIRDDRDDFPPEAA